MRDNTHSVKRSCRADDHAGGRESTWEETCERVRREIASIVNELTPPECKVCTTLEVMLALKEQGFGFLPLQKIARHLYEMQRQGWIEGTDSGKLHLWSLTKEGRHWAREHPPSK